VAVRAFLLREANMDRRRFLEKSLIGLAAAQAGCIFRNEDPPNTCLTCPSPPTSVGPQTARVNMEQLMQSVSTQQCEMWCWAASISMIFGFYGHPITQAQIVRATYGNIVCLPSGSTYTIGADLSRPWIDSRGVAFNSQVEAAYDYFNGFNTFAGNQSIINALKANNPMLYCNRSHAMVLYSVSYVDSPFGPDIQRADVIDPWPFSPRSHALSQSELFRADLGGDMTFLAQVRIS
jgi:hypothetical protein